MLRVLGFAYTPICLGVIPLLGGLVGFFWWLAAFVVAVRQGLDFTTGKAIGTILLAFIPTMIAVVVIGATLAMIGIV